MILTENENEISLRLPHLLATPESGEVRELGYVAIISIEGYVKSLTLAEAIALRDWLSALISRDMINRASK